MRKTNPIRRSYREKRTQLLRLQTADGGQSGGGTGPWGLAQDQRDFDSAFNCASASSQFCSSRPGRHPLASHRDLARSAICWCVNRTAAGVAWPGKMEVVGMPFAWP